MKAVKEIPGDVDIRCLGVAYGYIEQCEAREFGMAQIRVDEIGRQACSSCVGCFVNDHSEALEIAEEASEVFRNIAMYDPLTGLLNKHAFSEEMTTLRLRGPIAAIVLDAIEFRKVNQNVGHVAGDALLKIIGGCISASLREEDAVIGRVGGDEFAVVASLIPRQDFGLSLEERVETVADRIQETVDNHEVVMRYNRLFEGRLGVASGYAIDEFGNLPNSVLLNAADPKGEKLGTEIFHPQSGSEQRSYNDMSPEEVLTAMLDHKEEYSLRQD